MATPNIYGELPPELAAGQIDIDRRQKIADAMLSQGMSPLGAGRMVGNTFVAPHWMEGVAKLAQTYAGNLTADSARKGRQQIGDAYNSMYADEIAKLSAMKSGSAPRPQAMSADDTAMIADQGGEAAPTVQDVAPASRQQIMDAMLGSKIPALRNAGMAQMNAQFANDLKDDQVVVAPGGVVLKNGVPIYAAPNREQKQQNPSNLARLMQERDQLLQSGIPETDPRVVAYNNNIRKESEIAKQIVPPPQKIVLTADALFNREKTKAQAKEEGKAAGQAAGANIRGSNAYNKNLQTYEGKVKTATLANDFLDSMIANIDTLVDKDGKPVGGFDSAFGQIDALFPNFLKSDKTSSAYKTLEGLRAQETMRGLSAAKEQVGQSFGSMQQKEWDRFTNLFKNIDPDQPDKNLASNLASLRAEAMRLRANNLTELDKLQSGQPVSGATAPTTAPANRAPAAAGAPPPPPGFVPN